MIARATVDWVAIARRVADGVDIAASDRVSVFLTDVAATDAVVAFVDECWRRSAVPQVVATDERFDASALRWADLAVLREAPPLEAAAMAWSDVHVSFRAMATPTVDADPERIAALRRGRGLVSTMRWEGTRWALVRVPTVQWATVVGLDADALMAEWIASFDADWADAETRMRALCEVLDRADLVVIEDEWGRLELPTRSRSWVPFSGRANWPDGEIATAPLEHEVRGTVRFPGDFFFAGVRVRDLELRFADGEVVDAAASEGIEFARQLMNADPGARRVGELGIGTNAALSTYTGDLLIDEKILGTVHIALGRAYPECGGVNESALHWDIVKDLRIGAGSLRADDTWLIHHGKVLAPLAAASVADSPLTASPATCTSQTSVIRAKE